ncbi:MAG: DUF454 domain-containing protein [Lentisphaerae bacterium]|nr:DUF454 domain-containing protein [Lentisphaerota bacterium]
MKQLIYRILAIFFIILGIIGIFLPVMPTVPFLLAALYFAADSPRLQYFLHHNILLKNYVECCQGKHVISKTQCRIALVLLWLSLIVSAILVQIWYCHLILLTVGLLVSWHLLHISGK